MPVRTKQAGLRRTGSHFTLEVPFGPPFSAVWVEDLTVKVHHVISWRGEGGRSVVESVY